MFILYFVYIKDMNTSEKIEMLVFHIVRQGLNLKVIEQARQYPCGEYLALKHIVILSDQEAELKQLFRIKTAYKNKSIKEFPEFIKLFNKEACFQ